MALSSLDELKQAAKDGDWIKANAIARRFPRLDKDVRAAVLDAHMARTNPRFLVQCGKDVDATIAAGNAALVRAYNIAL